MRQKEIVADMVRQPRSVATLALKHGLSLHIWKFLFPPPIFFSRKTKKPIFFPEMGLSLPGTSCDIPAALLRVLFGNPAILFRRTRGFASPDFSGFAFIGVRLVFSFKRPRYPLQNLFDNKTPIFSFRRWAQLPQPINRVAGDNHTLFGDSAVQSLDP